MTKWSFGNRMDWMWNFSQAFNTMQHTALLLLEYGITRLRTQCSVVDVLMGSVNISRHILCEYKRSQKLQL